VFTSPASLAALLGTVAQTLASLAGIAIAVTLVALEILRVTYAGVALREMLRTGVLQRLLTLFLFTISIALGAVALIGSTVTPRVVGLSYLAGVLTIICFGTLYPSIKSILASTRVDRQRLETIAAAVNADMPFGFHRVRSRSAAESLGGVETNPLYLLSEIAIRSISQGDRVTPRLVVDVAASRLIVLLESKADAGGRHETRDLFNLFLQVFRPAARTALKHSDEGTPVKLRLKPTSQRVEFAGAESV
jgi:hypothetical protein